MKLTRAWRWLVNWFENGDLMPPVILVSVPHYAFVLKQYEFWAVAAVLGFLVDVGHYRTIKAFLNGRGWFWMVVLTAFSYGFHVSFYVMGGAGWAAAFLGGAVPAVIFSLAWIAKSERLDVKAARAAGNDKALSMSVAKVAMPELPLGTPDAPQLTSGKPLTQAEQYAAEHGVSIRTAYRKLKEIDNASKTDEQDLRHNS